MAAKGVSSGPMGRGGRALRSVECALVLVLAATVGWLATRDREREDARFRLEADASTAAARIHQLEQSTAAAIHDAALLAARAEALAQANGSMIATVHDSVARHDSFLEAQGRTLEELSWRQDSQFHATQANLQDRVDALCARVDHDHDTPVTAEARFRIIQRQADPSVFLVHCTFDYETKDLENEWTRHSATTWGTAFAVTDDGHLVTNKHLVQPWKFDAELRALEALGEVRIHEDSVKLAAWPVGRTCLDAKKQAVFDTGYSNTAGTLALVATAEDVLTTKSVELAGRGSDYTVHALDNHDLAMLVVTGAHVRALPMLATADEATLGKLDPVMALGFPRGSSGLESTVAESSASMGTIRKIEDTVHITAPIVAGNSGGPVFDADGRVIGIATRIYSETLGICIKIGYARELLERTRLAERLAIAASVGGGR